MFSAVIKGVSLSASLIMAIGSQNAHVLRMGLRREHVLMTVACCVVCEALLISAGVLGIGQVLQLYPSLLAWAKWGGALFLLYYGGRAFYAAWQDQSMQIEAEGQRLSWQTALAMVLAVTLLNPHVYLDTVLLLGSVAAQQGETAKWWFALGAVLNAVIWYSLLGFGARLLTPLFARPIAWRVLDYLIALMMLLLAASLVWG